MLSTHGRQRESEGEPARYYACIFSAWHINCTLQTEITHKLFFSCFLLLKSFILFLYVSFNLLKVSIIAFCYLKLISITWLIKGLREQQYGKEDLKKIQKRKDSLP